MQGDAGGGTGSARLLRLEDALLRCWQAPQAGSQAHTGERS